MADLSYVLYDTIVTGTLVFDNQLFQTVQGGDATHTEDFTNARGSGFLPMVEKFTVKKIGFMFDPAIAQADLSKLAIGSFMQLRVNDQIRFWSPLALLFAESGYQGFAAIAAAAGQYVTGNDGQPYELEIPVEISGGEKFNVRVKTTQATAATSKLVCLLYGTLTLAG